ncbi:hypothetical protein D3C75_1098540 [compost metagenome]
MYAQVVDPVIVLNHSVAVRYVDGAEAIFGHEQRLLVAVIQLVQRQPQPFRINLPSPVAFRQMRITDPAGDQVAFYPFQPLRVGADGTGHVIAKRDEVDRVLT